MSVDTLLRKEKDGTLYKHTKLSSALEDAREKTLETIGDATTSHRLARISENVGALAEKFGLPKRKPTSMKDRWRRLLARRGEDESGAVVKTAEPPQQ